MLQHSILSGKNKNGIETRCLALGEHFVLFSLETSSETADEILNEIEKTIISSPQISPQDLLNDINKKAVTNLQTNFIIAQFTATTLHLAKQGSLGAKLLRQGNIIGLLPTVTEEKNLKGPIKSNDVLILGTKDFFEIASLPNLARQDEYSVLQFRDDLISLVPANSEKNLHAVFVRFVDQELKISVKETISSKDPLEEELLSTHKTPPPEKNLPNHQEVLTSHPQVDIGKTFSLPKTFNPLALWHKRKMYLHHSEDFGAGGKMRKPLFLTLVALTTLVCLIAFQLRSKSVEQNTKAYLAAEKEIQDSVESAKKIANLNPQIARETLLAQQKSLDAKIGNISQDKWSLLSKRLSEELLQVSKIFTVSKLDLFYDFGLLKSSPKISSAKLYNQQIAALDTNNGAVYLLGTATKKAAILGGSEELKQARLVDISQTESFVWGPNGIFQKTLESEGAFKKIVSPSGSWNSIADLVTFANNAYLLDTGKNQIWKYSSTTFPETPYLGEGKSLDFSKVNSFAIDGSAFVLSSSGTILQFNGGNLVDFSVSGLPEPLNGPSNLFTTDELQNIYFFNANKSQILVINKKGQYQAQYQLPMESQKLEPKALLVDEKVKKVFLVTTDKVYSFELN